MSERPERDPLESALAGLKPAPSSLDRDRLMFAAGQAAATPARPWLWPASSAALLCLSLGLGGALATRPGPVETVRIVYEMPTEPSAPSAPVLPSPAPRPDPEAMMVAERTPPLATDYLRLRRQVLRFGVESLPDAPPLSSGTKTLSIDSLVEPPKKRS